MWGYTWSFRALESWLWSEPLSSASKGLDTVIYLHGLELTNNTDKELVYDTKYDFLSNMNSQPHSSNHFCSTKHCKLESTEANFQSNRRTKGPQIWSRPDGCVGTYSEASSPTERQQNKTHKNKQVTGSCVMCSFAIILIIHFWNNSRGTIWMPYYLMESIQGFRSVVCSLTWVLLYWS